MSLVILYNAYVCVCVPGEWVFRKEAMERNQRVCASLQ